MIDRQVAWELLLLSLTGMACLAWAVHRPVRERRRAMGGEDQEKEASSSRMGRPPYRSRRGWRGVLLPVLAALAALVWLGAGRVPVAPDFPLDPGRVHVHEWAHYYLGSKYGHELSYDRLYTCINVADAQDGLPVGQRGTTDLRTNRIISARFALTTPWACTDHFTAERWEAFRRDERYFRSQLVPSRWDIVVMDHGYNPSPVWTALGGTLAGLGSAGEMVPWLVWLDPLLMVMMLAAVAWAFGRRALTVGILVLCAVFPAYHGWTGGAFLRWDWLLWTVLSVCLVKKNRPLLAGIALGYAACLRVFPVFLFTGPLLVLARYAWQQVVARGWRGSNRTAPSWTRPFKALGCDGGVGWAARFTGGGLLAVFAMVPVSVFMTGVEAWPAFMRNLAKTHQSSMSNTVGLATALRPLDLPASAVAGLRAALVLAMAVLLARAVHRAAPWTAVAVGTLLLPAVTDLLCYYYMIVIVVALLALTLPRIGVWLLGLCVATQSAALFRVPNLSGGPEEPYVLVSVCTLAVFMAILWHLAHTPEDKIALPLTDVEHRSTDSQILAPGVRRSCEEV